MRRGDWGERTYCEWVLAKVDGLCTVETVFATWMDGKSRPVSPWVLSLVRMCVTYTKSHTRLGIARTVSSKDQTQTLSR
jgi:hypothetical protein